MRFPSSLAHRSLGLVAIAAAAIVALGRPPAARAFVGIAPQVQSEDVVVARVEGRTIGARELRERLAKTPPFMLEAYGSTQAERVRGFLDKVLVRELLLTVEAESRKLDQRADVADRLRGVLRGALVSKVADGIGADAITDEEVKRYYQDNIDRFVSPRRVGVWRILVGTAEEAKAILDQLGENPDPKVWNDLAREKSLDKDTNLRSGNLGFLEPDGTTGEADKTYPKELFDAVDALKDGEIAKQPVKEGARFAVVWRRQGMRAVTRTVESEAPTIRRALSKEKTRGAVQQIVDDLRGKLVTEVHPELCDMITVTDTAEIQRISRPGTLPKVKRTTKPQPNETPAGLR